MGGVGPRPAPCGESLWGSNFLPSGPVLAEVWSFPQSWPDQTICLFEFLVLLRDELPWFPSGNTFQQAVGSRGPGPASVGLLGLDEVLLDVPVSLCPVEP